MDSDALSNDLVLWTLLNELHKIRFIMICSKSYIRIQNTFVLLNTLDLAFYRKNYSIHVCCVVLIIPSPVVWLILCLWEHTVTAAQWISMVGQMSKWVKLILFTSVDKSKHANKCTEHRIDFCLLKLTYYLCGMQLHLQVLYTSDIEIFLLHYVVFYSFSLLVYITLVVACMHNIWRAHKIWCVIIN